jgi:hypothetical protein
MKRILWCGGSHLAHAKNHILDKYSSCYNEFAVTAADFHHWYLEGNRISIGESGIEGLHLFRDANRASYQYNHYDACVFVGQYVQPTRYFSGASPLSSALIADTLHGRGFLLEMRAGHAIDAFGKRSLPQYFKNQPLDLFSRLFSKRVVLVHDPLPCIYPAYLSVPLAAKRQFLKSVQKFCLQRNINLHFQRESTIDENWMTKAKYQRSEGDYTHVDDSFWELIFHDLVIP